MKLFRLVLLLAALGTAGACGAPAPTQPEFPGRASFDLEPPPPPPPPPNPTMGSGT